MATSILGFPSKSIIVHYDLAEIGQTKSPLPENAGRPIHQVIKDCGNERDSRIDTETFAPLNRPYPKYHENLPSSVRKSKLLKAWGAIWQFCEQREMDTIAVVCHFNVIKFSLNDKNIKPQNAIPIECRLYQDGTLEVVETHEDKVKTMTETLADLKKKNEWCMQMRPLDQNCHVN
jgi:hypothetical protein